jgi:hypothetical protein
MGSGEVVRRVEDVAELGGEVFVNAGHGVDVWGAGMLQFWGAYSPLPLLVLDSILVRSVSI